jgi:hypothetical protein
VAQEGHLKVVVEGLLVLQVVQAVVDLLQVEQMEQLLQQVDQELLVKVTLEEVNHQITLLLRAVVELVQLVLTDLQLVELVVLE